MQEQKRHRVIMSVLATVAPLGFQPYAAADDSPFSDMAFDRARAEATRQNRLLLVYFSAADNVQCETFSKLTWTNPEVGGWLAEHVIAIEVRGKAGDTLRERFDVRVSPTTIVLSPDGTVWARIIGFREPEALLGQLAAALAASDPLTLARRRVEAGKDTPTALLAYARTLEEADRFDEALKQYLRCFEQATGRVRGFGGLQLVVLDELGRLARRYPPARDALVRRRDICRKRLLRGEAERTDPAVFAAANTHLDQLDDTLSVYAKLREAEPDSLSTRLLRECAVDSALALKRYDRIAELIDVAEHARRAYGQYQHDVAKPVPPGADYDRFRALERQAFVERAVKFYEMLVGAARYEDAAAVASTVLTVDGGADAHLALAWAGLRTGSPTEADVEYARKAVELAETPGSSAVSTLVELLLHLHRRGEASTVVERYAPKLEDPKARENLHRLLKRDGKR